MTFRNRSLKWELWPEEDRSAWEAAVSRPSLFANTAPIAYMSQASRSRIYKCYCYWLNYLKMTEPSALSEQTSRRVRVGRVVGFADFLHERVADHTRVTYIQGLFDACRSLDSKRDWGWLREFVNTLYAEAGPPREKHFHSSPQLFWLGVRLMESAVLRSKHGCVQYRDGLMIALLAVRPIRRRNLAALKTGKHLIETRDGYRLRIEAAETKTKQHVEADIPDFLNKYLDIYLNTVRRRFPDSDVLDDVWLNIYGGALHTASFYARIRKHTGNYLGQPIGPHAFRVAAATTVAREAPTEVLKIPTILGNRGYEAVERFYNLATTYDASLDYTETINALLEELD